MSASTYLSTPNSVGRKKNFFTKALVAILLTLVFSSLAVSSAFTGHKQSVAAADEGFDVVKWVMCLWGDESVPALIYQTTQSSDLQFALQSKSVISPWIDNVETGPLAMNWMLDLSGSNFKKTNETILGHALTVQEKEAKIGTFNSGPKLNPFDRFGVAGLTWTSYAGEWKYVIVKACQSSDVTDPKAGMFYDTRLPPMSVWEDRENSLDVRTQQHAAGLGTSLLSSLTNLIANFIFNIAKMIIVITLGLINFAFTDLVKLMGLDEWLAGTGNNTGMFGKLFTGIFEPFIFVVFTLTALNILWHGIVKRQFRTAINVLVRSLILFFTAFLIAAQPAFFIALPNNVAVGVQAVMVSALNQGLAGGNGLCATDAGVTNTKIVQNTSASEENILEQASKNMRSAIGCSFWQQFLLKPWVQGQYGKDWNELWAKDKVPGWATDGKALNNGAENATMVGDAAVPLGGGRVLNNWAIFQISTQTDAHSPVGHPDQYSKYTSNVANDWWRIVDVLANYEEETKTAKVGAQGGEGGGGDVDNETVVTYSVPKNNPHLSMWDQWVGNNVFNRLGTALSAVFVALIGVIAPLFFAFLTALYALGMGLLMAFSPLMLLLGCWAGPGWEIFKSWGQLVINTLAKRIAAGVLMVLSIAFSAAAIKIMETESWWEGILLMVLLSIILIRSRHKIIDAFASIKFASQDFSGNASRISGGLIGSVKQGKTLAFAGTMGAVSSARAGGSAVSGAKVGMKTEFRNMSYRSKFTRAAMQSYDATQQRSGKATADNPWAMGNVLTEGQMVCAGQGEYLNEGQMVYWDSVGNVYCEECMLSGDYGDKEKFREEIIKSQNEKDREAERNKPKERLESSFQKIKNKNWEDEAGSGKLDEVKLSEDVGKALADDINEYRTRKAYGLRVDPPNPPDRIAPYLDIPLLKEAWEKGQYDYIKQIYAVAWTTWAIETFEEEFAELVEEILTKTESSSRAPEDEY